MRPIAFFDSGIGGLTVLQEAIKIRPNASYIYYSDSDNVPYGLKSATEISQLVHKAIAIISQHKPLALVLACNTATSVVAKELRAKYSFPIIGMEPAVKPATELSSDKRILVSATVKTLNEKKLDNLIEGLGAETRIDKLDLQDLVMFAENQNFNSKEVVDYLKEKLFNLDWSQYNSLVLGCTHFIYFRKLIASIISKDVQILDGNEGTIKHLFNSVSFEEDLEKNEIQYFISGKNADPKLLIPYFDYLKS